MQNPPTKRIESCVEPHTVEFEPIEVGPGESRRVIWQADRLFRGRHLTIGADVAPHFDIEGIFVGRDRQAETWREDRSCTCALKLDSLRGHKSDCNAVTGPPYSAMVFGEDNTIDFKLDAAPPGIFVSLAIKNVRDVPHVFHAKLQGDAIQPSTERSIVLERKREPRIKFLGPTIVKAGETAEFRVKIGETDAPFDVNRLVVPTGAPFVSKFLLVSWEVNGKSGFKTLEDAPVNIPIAAFIDEAVGTDLHIELRYRDETVIRVQNTGSADEVFAGLLLGEWAFTYDRHTGHEPGSMPVYALLGDLLASTMTSKQHEPGEVATLEYVCEADWLSVRRIALVSHYASHFLIDDVLVRGESIVQGEKPFAGSDIDDAQAVRDHNLGREPRLAFKDKLRKGDRILVVARNIAKTPMSLMGMLDGWGPVLAPPSGFGMIPDDAPVIVDSVQSAPKKP